MAPLRLRLPYRRCEHGDLVDRGMSEILESCVTDFISNREIAQLEALDAIDYRLVIGIVYHVADNERSAQSSSRYLRKRLEQWAVDYASVRNVQGSLTTRHSRRHCLSIVWSERRRNHSVQPLRHRLACRFRLDCPESCSIRQGIRHRCLGSRYRRLRDDLIPAWQTLPT